MENSLTIKSFKSLLPLLLLALAVILLYLPAINEFVYDWWHDDNYSHGFLIPVISGYLLWQKRKVLQNVEIRQNRWGLLLLVFGLALNILGSAAAEWYSVRFSMIPTLMGLVLYFGGTGMLRLVWFPIAFMVFAIPLPYTLFRTLTFPLQLFSTKVTHHLITAIGVPALRQGNILHLPGYSLEVVEACSGLRSIITLSALAAAFAYMTPGGPVRKLLLFSAAIPIAIFANIVRLLVTCFGALLISSSFAEGFLHEFSCVLVFLVGLALFFMIGSLLEWIGKKLATGSSLA